jgi:hypothetical protein
MNILDMIARGWENVLARPEGKMSLRLILQPTVATIIAVRAGLKDAREGRPAYLWGALTEPAHRKQFLRSGWKDVRMVFLMAALLDSIYQVVTHRSIYPFEVLFTATLLALVPYLVLRGPVNRVASGFKRSPPPARTD